MKKPFKPSKKTPRAKKIKPRKGAVRSLPIVTDPPPDPPEKGN